MRWDPRQYSQYADERGRPFVELIARFNVVDPQRVVDLGCGPGNLTALLLDRWPDAIVVGVDSSRDMVEAANEYAVGDRLSFVEGDVHTWVPNGPVDVVVANAVFHWVPGHVDLLADIAGWLSPGGAIAFQVPDNFGEPSHTLLHDLRHSPRWKSVLGDAADREAAVERPSRYLDALTAAGLDADVWQTTYLHVLQGEDPVLEWVKGTALRPLLSALTEAADRDAFLDEYATALRDAYPRQESGTVFPFRRTFAVGHKQN